MGGFAASLARASSPKWIAGNYYGVRTKIGGTAGTSALAALQIYAVPVGGDVPTLIDRIAINVTTAAAAGKIARFMIFRPSTVISGATLVLDAGTALVDSVAVASVTVNFLLLPGDYASIVSDGTPTIETIQTPLRSVHGSATAGAANVYGTANGSNGGLSTAPATFPASAYTTNVFHLIDVRAA